MQIKNSRHPLIVSVALTAMLAAPAAAQTAAVRGE